MEYMRSSRLLKSNGFTIVELLVVIVVIGVLTGISIVSYSSMRRRAAVATVKADLKNSQDSVKVYQATNGDYPISVTDCPNPAIGNVCLKLSSGNQVESYTVNNASRPQTFRLIIKNNNDSDSYVITEGDGPRIRLPIFNTGGSITTVNDQRIHTFSPGSYTITAGNSGSAQIAISGAGGGGGGGAACLYASTGRGANGSIGGDSLIIYSGGTWKANGGGGGYGGQDDCWAYSAGGGPGGDVGSALSGSATLTGWVSTVGGGGVGGSGGSSPGAYADGGRGGRGGKLVGSLLISSGQTMTVTVGGGGVGGGGVGGAGTGAAGLNGSVIITYSY